MEQARSDPQPGASPLKRDEPVRRPGSAQLRSRRLGRGVGVGRGDDGRSGGLRVPDRRRDRRAGRLGQARRRLGVAQVRAEAYTTVLRGIPDLLVIYLFYFGGSSVLTTVGHLFGASGFLGLPGFLAGALAVGVVSGAYQTEVFRGAYRAVSPGEIEAARACGMSPAAGVPPDRRPAGAAPRAAGARQCLAGRAEGIGADLGHRRGRAAARERRSAPARPGVPFDFYLIAGGALSRLTSAGPAPCCSAPSGRPRAGSGGPDGCRASCARRSTACSAGVPLTLGLAAAPSSLGAVLALLLATMRLLRLAAGSLRWRALYVFVFRGTPLLVQIFLIYYGLGQFRAVRTSLLWPFLREPYWCAVLALALNTAAYAQRDHARRPAVGAAGPGRGGARLRHVAPCCFTPHRAAARDPPGAARPTATRSSRW